MFRKRIRGARLVALVAVMQLSMVLARPCRDAHAEAPRRAAGQGPAVDESQARAFFEIGAQAYEKGRYEAAIEAFENAYQRARRTGLLFSMAQAHRRAFFKSGDATHLGAAVEHYREYLASPGELPRMRDAERALERLVPLQRKVARGEVDSNAEELSRLMVSSRTPGAVVQIDDGEAVTALPHVVAIPPGTHEVTLSAPAHAKHARRIEVPAGATFALDVDLQPLPGRLSLTGLEGSEVWLDGRLVAGLPVSRLAVGAGTHGLVVRKPGKLSYERRIRVLPARDTQLDVALSNTWQRDTSLGLLAGAGACLIGTGVFALMSLHQQGAARAYLETRSERALLSSERDAYEAAARRRDTYRSVAIGTGLSGAALGIAGALLFGLDTPPLPSAPGQAEAGPVEEQPSFEALPGFDASSISLQIRGRI